MLDLVTYVLWICDLDVKSGDFVFSDCEMFFFFCFTMFFVFVFCDEIVDIIATC